MANEVTLSLSISCTKQPPMSSAVGRSVANLLRNMANTPFIEGSFSVPITATVIPMGNVTSPHYGWFYNSDPTNYLQLQNGAAGAVFARLVAGDYAIVPLDPGITLYGISNTAACLLEYLIFST